MSAEAKYTELFSYQNPNVDVLYKIYQKNKYNARVYFMNESSNIFANTRCGIFDEPNGDFTIVVFTKKHGISKTNKMYNRESRVLSIIKKGNKFYFKQNKTFLPLTYSHLMGINFDYKVVPTLVERLPWLRFMTEHNICRNVSFNTMVSKKIFSLEKALRHEYKLPLPAAKILVDISDYQASYLKYYIEYLDNVENLHNTLPTYDFGIFYDTVKMAKTLDKRVNCSWSTKRLKDEHDKWSKEITDIVFTENDRKLTLGQIYLDFAESSGFKILQTTKEMNLEGRRQNHCVATYVKKADNGNCAIYSISDYTLELTKSWINNYTKQVLQITQFKGYKNCEAPQELYDMVKSELVKFNGVDYVGNVVPPFQLDDVMDLF
jgi:hypothetical protein